MADAPKRYIAYCYQRGCPFLSFSRTFLAKNMTDAKKYAQRFKPKGGRVEVQEREG